jgi:hypothetical protein
MKRTLDAPVLKSGRARASAKLALYDRAWLGWRRCSFAMLLLLGAGTAISAAELEIRRLRSDSIVPYSVNSGFTERAEFVVRDAAAWESLWNRVQGRRRPAPPLPAVDFTMSMVVVVALGRKSTGGFSISIVRALRQGDATVVEVLEESPGSECPATAGFTEPVDLALLPRGDGPVTFRVDTRITSCR